LKYKIFLILFIFISNVSLSQLRNKNNNIKTESINKKRFTGIIITDCVLYSSSMTGLYYLWYKDYPQTSFHFINDNKEWLQMDKIGHATTSYCISRFAYESFKWAGVDNKKSVFYGGGLGFAYLTTIEILDGFSKEWGSSSGDLLANTFGSALFISQQLAWNQQKIILKYSFHKTKYSKYREDALGSNIIENMLKDYNGQTYWLSFNINSLIDNNINIPDWLNFSLGYGADGMLGGNANPLFNDDGVPLPNYKRQRQYYLSFDIDMTKIKTKSKFLKEVFKVFNFIKIPFPALEYNKTDNFKFHLLYF